jgi:hypothetical protein
MDSQNVSQIAPVPQSVQQDPAVDVWDPPFERWLRLADSLLGNVPARHQA